MSQMHLGEDPNSHVRRQGNCVAHRLARRTISNSYYDIIDFWNHDLIMIE